MTTFITLLRWSRACRTAAMLMLVAGSATVGHAQQAGREVRLIVTGLGAGWGDSISRVAADRVRDELAALAKPGIRIVPANDVDETMRAAAGSLQGPRKLEVADLAALGRQMAATYVVDVVGRDQPSGFEISGSRIEGKSGGKSVALPPVRGRDMQEATKSFVSQLVNALVSGGRDAGRTAP